MSTARTTPAQKPRGRTRKSTFPLVSVGIFFLSEWFIKTLSYLREGVSWMEIGEWGLHRRTAGFGKPALQKRAVQKHGGRDVVQGTRASKIPGGEGYVAADCSDEWR